MGIIFMWLQGNDVEELKKEREKRLEEIKAIDEKIAELERKN